ncbi:HSPB1-associated protein 1 [Venturia canescens]|uniref:HSPB1-associated protein 1 n=1 Tax=Venturia canescens TaxID=32260 RepID=UPI001C9C2D9F|nr:HSPB1-associated protein 1 [Venturia canescens]
MLPPAAHLHQAILELEEPVKFQDFYDQLDEEGNLEFLRWGPDKFFEILGNKILPFRTGNNTRTCEPQWDVKCSTEEMKFADFLETTTLENDSVWRYFDYKYMSQWFESEANFLKSIDWKRFGFDKNGFDSTLWIGSKRAHTNCHQDSYGCNLVAQIHGRKLWLLFPPDTGNAMKPTRVPYEESTIYSEYNFFCPTIKDEESIMNIKKNARLVVLEPGDVLLVPNRWWHYVESLDFSISINVWLPVEGDFKERINEALVKLLARNIGLGLPAVPEPEYSPKELIELIKLSVSHYNSELCSGSSSTGKKKRPSPWTAEELAKEYPKCVKLLPELSQGCLREWLMNNRKRFPEVEIPQNTSNDVTLVDIINALCNREVISKVSELLLHDR